MPEVPFDLLAAGGIEFTIDGPVARVTLARPQTRNAQTPQTWRALAAVGAAVTDDVRVVVVRAQGESFSAGLHRAMFTPQGLPDEGSLWDVAAQPPDQLDQTIAAFQRAFNWLRTTQAVTIAAVQGHAIGAGFQLALACDLRVCADDVRFAMRETSLGLVPDLTGTKPLVEIVGYARALEICATGRWVGAREAAELGLATAVVPREELNASVDDLVAALLAPPAGSLVATKRLLRGAADRTHDEQEAAERAAQAGRLAELRATGRPGGES